MKTWRSRIKQDVTNPVNLKVETGIATLYMGCIDTKVTILLFASFSGIRCMVLMPTGKAVKVADRRKYGKNKNSY